MIVVDGLTVDQVTDWTASFDDAWPLRLVLVDRVHDRTWTFAGLEAFAAADAVRLAVSRRQRVVVDRAEVRADAKRLDTEASKQVLRLIDKGPATLGEHVRRHGATWLLRGFSGLSARVPCSALAGRTPISDELRRAVTTGVRGLIGDQLG